MVNKYLAIIVVAVLCVACGDSKPATDPSAAETVFADAEVDLEDAELVEVDDDGEIADGTENDATAGDDTETERTLGDDTGTIVLGCEPLQIGRTQECDAVYGEEAVCGLAVTGACNAFTCSKVSGPDWASVDGTNLKATPTALGVHTTRVRCVENEDGSRFVEREFEIPVTEEIGFEFFIGTGAAPTFNPEAENVLYEDGHEFTASVDVPCVRALGHAPQYTITDNADHLEVTSSGPDWACFNMEFHDDLNEEEQVEFDGVLFHASDEFGNEAEATVSIVLKENPCLTPLSLELIYVRVGDDIQPSNPDRKFNAYVGDAFVALYRVSGGGVRQQLRENASGVLSVESRLDPFIECEGSGNDWRCQREGSNDRETRRARFATTNEGWEISSQRDASVYPELLAGIAPGEIASGAYIIAATGYDGASFGNRDIPFVDWPNAWPKEQMTISVHSERCDMDAELALENTLQPRQETINKLSCRMDIDGIHDTGSDSRMDIILSEYEGSGGGYVYAHMWGIVEYPVNSCDPDDQISRCQGTRAVRSSCSEYDNCDDLDSEEASHTSIQKIDYPRLVFGDYSDRDHFCFDCDHDQMDAAVNAVWCKGQFWEFLWNDDDNRIGDDVTPVQDQDGWDNAGLVMAEGLALMWSSFLLNDDNKVQDNEGDWHLWRPRLKPNWNDEDEPMPHRSRVLHSN